MKHYSLHEITRALEQTPDMPFGLMPGARETMLKTALKNPSYSWVLPYMRELVEKYRKTPIEAPSYTAYAAWAREGTRSKFDASMYALRTRLNMMTVAALLDVDGAKEQYEDILYAFLHLPTWALSAHHFDRIFEDTWDDIPEGPFDADGRIRGIGRSRKQCLDLCACSAAFGIAESAQLLEGRVEKSLLRWARQECYHRVLGNFMQLSPYPHFEINPNNWSGVCMSSIGGAAIYLITKPRTLAPVLMRVIEALNVHLSGYYDDGTSPEGFGYWQYGFEYFLMFADLLRQRSGGRIDLLGADEKIRRIAGFGADCCFKNGLKLPFGDCNIHGVFDESLRRYIGARGINVPPEGDMKKSFDSAFEHTNMLIRHLAWDMQPQQSTLVHPRAAVYPVSQMFMGFYKTPEDPVYLLVKGGNNGESHNHNDVGTFVIIRGDQMLAADTTGGSYSKEYFSDKRYTFFGTRSGGHNFPMVDGVEQEGHGRCRCARFESTYANGTDTTVMDLGGTLNADALDGFTRKVSGERASGRITVEDVFTLNRPAEIRDRVIVPGETEKLAEGRLLIGGKDGMILTFDSGSLRAVITPTEHTLEGKKIYTLDLMPKTARAGELTVKMQWETA
ncbi:MAG: heparinase II/III family protein [Clostridia bacterium]|nr:heparinase II/III family protein [Clostridia bacterium]